MLGVSRETHDRLRCYVACLERWNPTINLISARSVSDIWERHIADGVAIATLLADRPGPAADLGSGAGIPGLVAAIVTGRAITLVEADRRKAAFLTEAARETGAPVMVLPARAETCALNDQAIVMARALAPLNRLLTLCAPLMNSFSCGLFFKGQDAAREVAQARQTFAFDLVQHTIGSSLILEVTHITHAA